MSEIHVGKRSDFDFERRRIVSVNGREVVVFCHEGSFYALENNCVHMGGPVGEGILMPKVEGEIAADGSYTGDTFSSDITHIVCPWHGWEYDIETGRAAGDPALGLRRYQTLVRGNDVYVRA